MSLFDSLVEAVKNESVGFELNKKFLSSSAIAAIYKAAGK